MKWYLDPDLSVCVVELRSGQIARLTKDYKSTIIISSISTLITLRILLAAQDGQLAQAFLPFKPFVRYHALVPRHDAPLCLVTVATRVVVRNGKRYATLLNKQSASKVL
jgi:hypothetical protein